MIRRSPVLTIFVLSGFAGLIYEVVWARQLVLVFGNTTQAQSTILTGFFGGIAIGSVWGGRLGDRVRRPLRLYGLLELALVLIVLATSITFRLLNELYRGAYGSLEGDPGLLALLRFGLALAALGPATILMGATLPILTRHLSKDSSELSSAFSRLYAYNTIGGILGTIAAGLVLIELLGLTGTLLIGAATSATAGIAALLLDRGRQPLPAPRPASLPREAETVSQPPRIRLAIALAFVSGLTSLGYQVLWMRLLATGTGNSTYVFTIILAIFLNGLAWGALLYSDLRNRIKDLIGFLALAQIGLGVCVALGMAQINRHPIGSLNSAPDLGEYGAGFVMLVLVVVFPATVVMGLTLPAASSLVADPRGRIATNSGILLAANTIGAIVATCAIPFVVIPAIGSAAALASLVLVNLAVGVSLSLIRPLGAVTGRLGTARLATATAGAVLGILIVLTLATSRVFVDPGADLIRALGGRVFHSREDEIASVQAGEISGEKQLWVTGHSMTVLTVDAKLMVILPLMLRPSSVTELTIAFGMGSTFRTSVVAGLHTTAVELVPSVPMMFGDFYRDASRVLSNPHGNVIIADGRNHVELTTNSYDIIVCDPPPPIQTAGVSVISSREFYRAARRKLNPGGVMMQWVTYGQTVDEFKSHVRTFHDVFRNVIVAAGPGRAGHFLLGSDAPIVFSESSIREVLQRPGVLLDLSSASDAPKQTEDGWAEMIPRFVRLSGIEVAGFAGSGPLITDDHPLPEYYLVRRLLGPKSPELTGASVAP